MFGNILINFLLLLITSILFILSIKIVFINFPLILKTEEVEDFIKKEAGKEGIENPSNLEEK